MVLLIACANVANLVLVRGRARQSDMAIRAALGAGRRGLVSYLLVENLLLAVGGGVLGLVLAAWGIDVLKSIAPSNLPRLDAIGFDVPTFAFALAVVTLTALLFGVGPSMQLSRLSLAAALGQRGTIAAFRGRWTRSVLLVGEVALSVVLLLGAGLLFRSLTALERTEMGFNATGLTRFNVSLPPARYPAPQVIATHDRLDTELAALPGVLRVARISGLPLGPSENVFNFSRPDRPAPPPGQAPIALYRVVDAEYFATMKIAVLAGRAFLPSDREGAPPVMIISRRMADLFWPGEDPVGRSRFRWGGPPATIVGVVANVRSQTLAQQAQPEMYAPHAQTTVRSVMYLLEESRRRLRNCCAAARAVVGGSTRDCRSSIQVRCRRSRR